MRRPRKKLWTTPSHVVLPCEDTLTRGLRIIVAVQAILLARLDCGECRLSLLRVDDRRAYSPKPFRNCSLGVDAYKQLLEGTLWAWATCPSRCGDGQGEPHVCGKVWLASCLSWLPKMEENG